MRRSLTEAARAYNRSASNGTCALRPLPLLLQPAAGTGSGSEGLQIDRDLHPEGFPATVNDLRAMTGRSSQHSSP